MKKNKLTKALTVANKLESIGAAFFNRNSNGDMSIFVRDERISGHNQWQVANETVENLRGLLVFGPEIDGQSGTLIIIVKGIYNE